MPGIAGVDPGRVGTTAGPVLGEFARAPLIESRNCEVAGRHGGCTAATSTPTASRSAGGQGGGRGAKRGRAATSRFLSRADMRESAEGRACTWTSRAPLALSSAMRRGSSPACGSGGGGRVRLPLVHADAACAPAAGGGQEGGRPEREHWRPPGQRPARRSAIPPGTVRGGESMAPPPSPC